MKKIVILVLSLLVATSSAFAYDVTVNFKQQFPELIAGWNVKAGPTKGGPYMNIQDCGKPTAKSDNSFDCKTTGYTANPAYIVVAPYNTAKTEIAQSAEATISVTVPPPTDVKVVLTITTVSRITKYGSVVASTTTEKKVVNADTIVKEGTTGYRTKDGRYITKTVIIYG